MYSACNMKARVLLNHKTDTIFDMIDIKFSANNFFDIPLNVRLQVLYEFPQCDQVEDLREHFEP